MNRYPNIERRESGPASQDRTADHEEDSGLVPFIALRYGEEFMRQGADQSVYRKLAGVAFECIEPAEGRALTFKAFDLVIVSRGAA